ncbi:MAG: hypothetical protein K1X78_10970 [Verrucomicrobiaceae bacterium]|nr:hypothetical protein [Verrucomicrobiaceae bacterium]
MNWLIARGMSGEEARAKAGEHLAIFRPAFVRGRRRRDIDACFQHQMPAARAISAQPGAG